jgi:hypothetical protein
MNAGITGVNAPHVLFEPLDVLVIFFFTVRATYQVSSDIALLKPAPPGSSNSLLHPQAHIAIEADPFRSITYLA